MLSAAGAMTLLLIGFAAVAGRLPHGALWLGLLVVWALLGASYSAAQLPTGRLFRRSAMPTTVRRCSQRNSPCRMRAGCSHTVGRIARNDRNAGGRC